MNIIIEIFNNTEKAVDTVHESFFGKSNREGNTFDMAYIKYQQ